MATLSALVKVIADAQGLDENQVVWIARHLREAGLITQGGRGRGGAQMTAQDAVNLLIGVNAPGEPKDAPITLEQFGQLALPPTARSRIRVSRDSGVEGEMLVAISRPATTFRESLASLIASFDHLPSFVEIEFRRKHSEREAFIRVGGYFEKRVTAASPVELRFGSDEDLIVTSYDTPDRLQSVTFTDRTLKAVGASLAT